MLLVKAASASDRPTLRGSKGERIPVVSRRVSKYSQKLPYVRKTLKIRRLQDIDYLEYQGSEPCTLREALLTSVDDMLYAKRIGGSLYCVHIPNSRKVDLCFVHSDHYEHFVLHLEEA